MSAHVFVAFWPVVRPETARRDPPWLIREATAALPGVTSAADAVITGTPQWGLMPGHRVPGAAAELGVEYTVPEVSQSLIITRMAGRTPVPGRESVEALAQHGASMVLFLSAGMLEQLQAALLRGAYTADTPAAIVYKASWPEELCIRCTVGTMAQRAEENGIRKTALVLVGDFLQGDYERSRLYDPAFTTEFRKGKDNS